MLAEEVTRSLYEFLIVYIHAVAYVAHVYPHNTFSLKSHYGMVQHECNHPGVKAWAEKAAKAVMELLTASSEIPKKATVSIVILEDMIPIERFGISLSEYELHKNLSQHSQLSQQQAQVKASEVMEEFRSCFARLYATVSEESNSQGQANRSMNILFEGHGNSSDTPNAWIKSNSKPSSQPRIYPIRSINLRDKEEQVLVLNTFRQPAK